MTINFLLILFLQAEHNLGWDNAFIRKLEVKVGIQRKRSRVLKQMSSDIFAIYGILHMSAILINSQGSENIKHTRVHDFTPISAYTNYNLLPGIWTPRLGCST